MGTKVDIKQIKGLQDILSTGIVRDYPSVTGTAAVATSPRWAARYDVTDPEVTEYTDGMKIAFVVPVAGNADWGTAFQINNLGYKPIVYGTNSAVSTRYPVGGIIIARYNATQTANIYLGSGHQNETVTGCWQVMDYDANTTVIERLCYNSGNYVSKKAAYRYTLMMQNLAGELIPLHSTAGNETTYNASTATDKPMTTESFSPHGIIALDYYPARVAEGGTIPAWRLYRQYQQNPQFTLNCGNTLTEGPLFLVTEPQPDGQVKLTTGGNPWTQSLPSTADGKIYIYIGYCASATTFELYPHHPAYWHNGQHVCIWSGDAKNEVEVSETEPTDPNVEIWINPDGEADIPTARAAARKNIIVHRALPLLTAKAGDRYYYQERITVKVPYDYEDIEEIDEDWLEISTMLPGGGPNTTNRIFKYTGSDYRYGKPTLVTVPENFDALLFLTDSTYRESVCSDGSTLTAFKTASPYFEIHKGEIICTKRTIVREIDNKLVITGSEKSGADQTGELNRHYMPYKGNGYGICRKRSRCYKYTTQRSFQGHTYGKPHSIDNVKGKIRVAGLARGKISIYWTTVWIKNNGKAEII